MRSVAIAMTAAYIIVIKLTIITVVSSLSPGEFSMTQTAVANLLQYIAVSPIKNKSLRRQLGQGMTEYIVIVALIAVAAIGVYQLFGQVVRSQTAAIVNEVGGVSGTASTNEANTAATAANSQRGIKGLNAYTGAATAAAAK